MASERAIDLATRPDIRDGENFLIGLEKNSVVSDTAAPLARSLQRI